MKILLGEVMIEKDITYQELENRSGISKATLHRMGADGITRRLSIWRKLHRHSI